VVLRPKKLEIRKIVKTVKEPEKKPNKCCVMKLSQICRRIELCMREIILPFEMNLQNLLFSGQNYSYSYSQAITEVLSYWAEETPGD
jgi:hypothetical protein